MKKKEHNNIVCCNRTTEKPVCKKCEHNKKHIRQETCGYPCYDYSDNGIKPICEHK